MKNFIGTIIGVTVLSAVTATIISCFINKKCVCGCECCEDGGEDEPTAEQPVNDVTTDFDDELAGADFSNL